MRLLRLHGQPLGVLQERNGKCRPGIVDLAQSTWFDYVQKGLAPKPIKIGRSSFWLQSDIEAWVERAKRESA